MIPLTLFDHLSIYDSILKQNHNYNIIATKGNIADIATN